MKHDLTQPVDLLAVEREARRLRAEAFAQGLRNFRVWLSRPRHAAGQRPA